MIYIPRRTFCDFFWFMYMCKLYLADFISTYVFMCMCMCMWVPVDARSGHLVLDVEEVVSHTTWVLGTKLGASRGTSALDHRAITPAPSVNILFISLYFVMHGPLV